MGSALPQTLPPAVGEWHASLNLQFSLRPHGCRLVTADREGPLSVQRPFYPEGEDLPHCYLLHPPGGLVSGDLLAIKARCDDNSRALLTTPGAGRAYRARERGTLQRQTQHFSVGNSASLEWLPMETIVYPGANLHSQTDVYLAENSQLIAWDVVCLGLPASGEDFTSGHFQQRTRLFQDDNLVLHDRFSLTAPSLLQSAAVGLNGNTVVGLFIAGSFSDSTILDACIEDLREQKLPLAITRIKHWLLARYLGRSAFEARKAYTECWRLVRPLLLNRPACPPRIWAT